MPGPIGMLNTNLNALEALSQLNNVGNKIGIAMQQISTGKVVNSAGDNPAAFALGQMESVTIANLTAAQSNMQDGNSMLQVAQSAQNSVQSLLINITADLKRAASGTVGSTERTAINNKLQQFVKEVRDISSQTSFNGVKLLSAASTNFLIQVGAQGSSVLTATVSGVAASTLGISGISATTQAAASAALSAVQKAVSNLTLAQESIGARMSRLTQKLAAVSVNILNSQAAQSTFVDANIANSEVDLVRNQVLQSATVAVLASANNAPQQLLTLLQGH